MSERYLMSLKGKLEAIIYAAEEPVTVDQLAGVLKEAGLVQQLLAPPAGDGEESLGEAPETSAPKDPKAEKAEVRARLRSLLDEMMASYLTEERGIEMRQ